MFTEADIRQFRAKNITIEKIRQQIEHFRNGFPYISLHSAATPEKGIVVLDEAQTAEHVAYFNDHAGAYHITKMVPASGAASRMFKELFTFLDNDIPAGKEVVEFLDKLESFAFYPALKKALSDDDYIIDELLAKGDYKTIIAYLLTDKGLSYASLPKGLLLFHKYDDGACMPLEEHLKEGLEYSTDIKGITHLHFTVSPEHKEKFIRNALKAIKNNDVLSKGKFDIGWSVQKPSTDTIAVDLQNEAFRGDDGRILFRPGGHGALIENLNDLDTDIAFIKNIDNVVPDDKRPPTYTYKKVLGGMLMQLMEKTHSILNDIISDHFNEASLEEAYCFASQELRMEFPERIRGYSFDKQQKMLYDSLNRPIRVCGMVKNEGEPGGGPFYTRDQHANISLQIVESSQIDMSAKSQKDIVAGATHFNPVDLACSLKDHEGKAFDLNRFIDPMTGFISIKSKDGKEIKAQELPGLWNGAMAHWITVFVEVPIETFNPVKTVNDLLRPMHR